MYQVRTEACLLLGAAVLAGCSDRNAPTAPAVRPLAATTSSGDHSTYTWSLTCNGKGSIGASWYWTENGAQITSSEQQGCSYNGQVRNTGLRPANANGFTAQVGLDSKSWTFDPAGPFQAKLPGSVGTNSNCHKFCWGGGPPKEDGTLTVDS